MSRVPVHIVSGAPASGKSALIGRLVEQRSDWLGLVNALPSRETDNLKRLSGGCPCCIGKLVLQMALVRGLRATNATRALIEFSNGAHVATFERLLGDPPLSRSVVLARTIVLPEDAGMSIRDFDV